MFHAHENTSTRAQVFTGKEVHGVGPCWWWQLMPGPRLPWCVVGEGQPSNMCGHIQRYDCPTETALAFFNEICHGRFLCCQGDCMQTSCEPDAIKEIPRFDPFDPFKGQERVRYCLTCVGSKKTFCRCREFTSHDS